MATQVSGFITEDGTFYELEVMARVHDAREALLMAVGSESDAYEFIEVVDFNLDIVKEYINAKQALVEVNEAIKSDPLVPPINPVIDNAYPSGSEANAGFQPFKIDGSGNLPDMGSGTRTEEVRHRSPLYGTGSGKGNARRIRRMSLMAGDEDTEA